MLMVAFVLLMSVASMNALLPNQSRLAIQRGIKRGLPKNSNLYAIDSHTA